MDPMALQSLDLVLGSFHSALRRKEDQTARYVAGIRNRDDHADQHVPQLLVPDLVRKHRNEFVDRLLRDERVEQHDFFQSSEAGEKCIRSRRAL